MSRPELRGIGFILSKGSFGEVKGTGYLVSSKFFITAAHAVCIPQTNKACSLIKFYPYANGNL